MRYLFVFAYQVQQVLAILPRAHTHACEVRAFLFTCLGVGGVKNVAYLAYCACDIQFTPIAPPCDG